MKYYDSFSKNLVDINKEELNVYLCGPTVYSEIHIGNTRPIILVDFFVRAMEYFGIKVNYLQNITDIDDKIIAIAEKEGVSEEVITKRYTDAYLNVLKDLQIRMPDKLENISDHIDAMIIFIDILIQKGYAYEVEGNVFFEIDKLKNEYGKLAHKNIDELIAGQRIKVNPDKKNELDFAIWKKTTQGKQWYTKWSKGRPGWHTECALLIDNKFGPDGVDIHFGGIDLQFPHHENSRIQFLAKNNHEISNIWMHNGYLTVDNEKMSKSLKNGTTAKNFLEKYGMNVLRYIFMTKNYTAPVDFNNDLIDGAVAWVNKVQSLLIKIRWQKELNKIVITENVPVDKELNSYHFINNFKNYLADDLNLPAIVTLINTMVKHLNLQLANAEIDSTYKKIIKILKVLGFDFDTRDLSTTEIEQIKKWDEAVSNKNFEVADKLRSELMKRGLI